MRAAAPTRASRAATRGATHARTRDNAWPLASPARAAHAQQPRGAAAPAATAPSPPPLPPRTVRTAAAARHEGPAAGQSERSRAASAPLPCSVSVATSVAALRACAYLRAIAFYSYPEGRSEFAAQSHRRMKTDAELDSVTAKIEGRDEGYRDVTVTCFVVTVPETSGAGGGAADSALEALRSAGMDACVVLSGADLGGQQGRHWWAVGTLDLNVGHALPSEELIGRLPQMDVRHRRAYLSNVCVAPAARRLGVARALLSTAIEAARSKGVEWVYVHVVHDNAAAVALYCEAMGFQVEQAESEATARALQRPRRLLLSKHLA